MRHAILEARMIAWEGLQDSEGIDKERYERISQYMDSIHNLPGFLDEFENWDESVFEIILKSNDEPYKIGSRLDSIYQQELIN